MHVDLSTLSRDALLRLVDLSICPDDESPFPDWLIRGILKERAARSADLGPFHTDAFLPPAMTIEDAKIWNRGLIGAALALEGHAAEQGRGDLGSKEAAAWLSELSQGLARDCIQPAEPVH